MKRLPFANNFAGSLSGTDLVTLGTIPGIPGYVLNLRGFALVSSTDTSPATGAGALYIEGLYDNAIAQQDDPARTPGDGSLNFMFTPSGSGPVTLALDFPEGCVVAPALPAGSRAGSYPMTFTAQVADSSETLLVRLNYWGEYIPLDS